MLASRCHPWSSGVILAFVAACLAGAMLPASVADAADVYFPATSAYHRRNYDPFDQTAPTSTPMAAAESRTSESGDIRYSSEIQLVGSDPFGQLPPATQVTPAAFQAAAPAQPESLPPPSAQEQAAAPDEPGADWSPKPLAELSTNIVLPGGVLPRNYWTERAPQHVAFFDPCGTTRGWPVNTFNWVPSCFCSNPLYFEEINLERYGYGCGCFGPCCSSCVQSAASAAHFFATVPALPYKMAVDCPCECDYTLGHYRPGSCPPWQYHCSSRASCLGTLSSGGVATGLIFLIP
ncbi:MAG: hypothetical protein WD971_00710 [Pirellulales bacterium]